MTTEPWLEARSAPSHCCHSLCWKDGVHNLYFHFSSSEWPHNTTWVGFQLCYPMTMTLTSLRNEASLAKETSGNRTFKSSIFSDWLACPKSQLLANHPFQDIHKPRKMGYLNYKDQKKNRVTFAFIGPAFPPITHTILFYQGSYHIEDSK